MGTLSEELQQEYPLWRIVQDGQSLTEVATWDLEDAEKYLALMDMKADYDAAYNAKAVRDAEKQRGPR